VHVYFGMVVSGQLIDALFASEQVTAGQIHATSGQEGYGAIAERLGIPN
jgi:hypothetical protein